MPNRDGFTFTCLIGGRPARSATECTGASNEIRSAARSISAQHLGLRRGVFDDRVGQRVGGHPDEAGLVALALVVVRPVLPLDVDDADDARPRNAGELGRPPLGARVDLHLHGRVERGPAGRVEVRRDDEPYGGVGPADSAAEGRTGLVQREVEEGALVRPAAVVAGRVLGGVDREQVLLVEECAPLGERSPALEREQAQAAVRLLVVGRVRDILAAALGARARDRDGRRLADEVRGLERLRLEHVPVHLRLEVTEP